ncbi:hypothetical protein PUN28_006549 [Cardiocondyla obscurior]|uniref:Uncharacterized protein n=1 Tax=Cardiocondyla obscurior TaxID=286306 RepID=A0AAW2G969_9HYME
MRREDAIEGSDRRRYRRQPDQLRRSRRFEEEFDDQNGRASPSSTGETNFLNRLRLKRRSLKLLSFLSGKAADRSQEERAARLLRLYMPEKAGARSTQNTISIHHTSRDRRFWKLRNRRRTKLNKKLIKFHPRVNRRSKDIFKIKKKIKKKERECARNGESKKNGNHRLSVTRTSKIPFRHVRDRNCFHRVVVEIRIS